MDKLTTKINEFSFGYFFINKVMLRKGYELT